MVVSMDTAKIVDTMKACMPGLRNDGVTPSWQHPLDVLDVFNKMTEEAKEAENVFGGGDDFLHAMRITCILHDILEDGKIEGRDFSAKDLAELIGYNFGKRGPHVEALTYNAVIALTKTGNTSFGTMGLIEYFTEQIACDNIAIFIKCCDRIANLREAEGVFSPYRLDRYRWETKMLVIPMLDNAYGFTKWDAWLRNELTELSYTENQPRKK